MKDKAITNGDDPAFATPDSGTESSTTWEGQKGLTKREYFAAMAMQGLCANYLRENVTGWDIKSYVKESILIADELIKSLNNA